MRSRRLRRAAGSGTTLMLLTLAAGSGRAARAERPDLGSGWSEGWRRIGTAESASIAGLAGSAVALLLFLKAPDQPRWDSAIEASILSMRGGERRLRQIPHEEMVEHDANLLLTTNEVNVSLHEYLECMGELTAEPPALQKAMLEYVYFVRKLLIGRRKMLQLTYNIFVYGLAVSVLLFVIAIVRP